MTNVSQGLRAASEFVIFVVFVNQRRDNLVVMVGLTFRMSGSNS